MIRNLLLLVTLFLTSFTLQAQCVTVRGVTTVPNTGGCSHHPTITPCFSFWGGAGVINGLTRGLTNIPCYWGNLPPVPNCTAQMSTYVCVVGFQLLQTPIPLDVIGMPEDCKLYVSPDISTIHTVQSACFGGVLYISPLFSIPNDPNLVGFPLYAQGFGFQSVGTAHYFVTPAIQALIR